MRRILFLFYALSFITFITALKAGSPPNVVIIYADDLGYGDLGCYGHPVIQTPHLDELAREGLRLTAHYSASALCSPSRAALLTGRTPYRTGIKSWIPHHSGIYLETKEVTLAELLRDQGYSTAVIGKWHLNSDLGHAEEPQPSDHGFDYSFGHNAYQTPTNRNPDNLFRNGKALGVVEGYTAQIYADEAIRWMKTAKAEETPFFLYFPMAEPHTPIENPTVYNEMYGEFTNGPIIPIPSGGPIPHDKLIPRGPGEYYANITYMDAQIGRLLDAIESAGLQDNTLVIFSSDNGPVTEAWRTWWEVNAYGSTGGFRGRKHWLYEGGIRVPAILRYPKVIDPGTESEAVSIGMDLFSTILSLTRTPEPSDRPIDGTDLSPLFHGDAPFEQDRVLFWALPTDNGKDFVIRHGDWKLILDSDQKPIELFNLSEDPLELFNLIEKESARATGLQNLFLQTYEAVRNEQAIPAKNF